MSPHPSILEAVGRADPPGVMSAGELALLLSGYSIWETGSGPDLGITVGLALVAEA